MELVSAARRPRVQDKTTRTRPKVKADVKTKLWLKSAGICSFPGCAKKLSEHSLTLAETNFSNIAHIVAYELEGPRGNHPMPVEQRNNYENLMMLCQDCHTLVDSNLHKDNYPVEVLQAFKKQHEEQIDFVREIYLKREKTQLLRCRANILNDVVQIPIEQMVQAISPRYPISRDFIDIDMIRAPGLDTAAYWQSKKEEISHLIESVLFPGGARSDINHLSVFALGPIPLLMHLGNCLSNKIPTDLFQRHRDVDSWSWKADGIPVAFKVTKLSTGSGPEVGMILSLSGKISAASIPNGLSSAATIYEVTLDGADATPTFLTSKKTLENFRGFYRDLISKITAEHKGLTNIHLFPAVPAPIAVLCGRELLRKVDPILSIHDFNKINGFFEFAMEVNNERK